MATIFTHAADAPKSFASTLKEGDSSAKRIIAVYIDVEPEKRDAFVKIMLECLEGSQKEAGVLEYTLWSDLKSPNSFFLYEEYVNDDAHKSHVATEHFKKFAKARDELGGVKMRAKFIDASGGNHKNKR